jgi:transposase
MERAWLEARLAEGRSIESIAKEVGKHPSTVGYWVKQHGLRSPHADRHAAKGAPSPEVVAALVEEGLSIQQMAERLGVGATTVRHWLRRYGLMTVRARRSAGEMRGQRVVIRECRRHGFTAWVLSGTGGRCILCGYDRYAGALQFHHLDPSTKSFALSVQGVARSLEKARAEAAKCVLICANCHAEVEAGVATIRL